MHLNNITYASRNLFTSAVPRVNCDAAVVWRIPPPNRNPSFEVSAIFPPVKLVKFLPMQMALSTMSRN